MQMKVMVAAIAATCFVTGCGFTPKKPPKPDDKKRIPVNLAAPYPHPWPPPRPLQVATQPNPMEVAIQLNQAGQPELPVESTIGSRRVADKLVVSTSENAPASKINSESSELAPLWPVTLAFNKADSLDSDSQFDASRVRFEWPRNEANTSAAKATQSQAPSMPERSAVVPIKTVTRHLDFAPIDSPAVIDMEANFAPIGEMIHSDIKPVAGDTAPSESAIADARKAIEAASEPEETATALPVTNTPDPTPLPVLLAWSAHKGMALSDLIREWGAKEDWTVDWGKETTDFRIQAPLTVEAPDFLTAANHIFNMYLRAGYEFIPVAHSNRVLVITEPKD